MSAGTPAPAPRRLRPRPARSLQTHSSFQLHLIRYLVNYFAIVTDCILFLFCPFYINRSIIIFRYTSKNIYLAVDIEASVSNKEYPVRTTVEPETGEAERQEGRKSKVQRE